MKTYSSTHRNTNVVSSYTHNAQFEAERIKSMRPHDRHQHMLEEHKQARATRRENHRKGIHKTKNVISRLI